ncbi:hypothetical protein [Chromobacterium haemolyticum]|uniref:hypothetical protein n=1 Tax=Chromobacterium haemolyticum TaxID=394935 RepID=UPI001316D133|nr:hypothetical protein [Chromobacterium haemolyticum]BBH12867.1 hypothetical protein CH06BL_21150 [Chromobacterium haemolyticum]
MSKINGTYKNNNINAQLVITDANDSNGTFSGRYTQDGQEYEIMSGAGHYHFTAGGKTGTAISFVVNNDVLGFQSWSLYSPDMSFSSLRGNGAKAFRDGTYYGFGGEFVRV